MAVLLHERLPRKTGQPSSKIRWQRFRPSRSSLKLRSARLKALRATMKALRAKVVGMACKVVSLAGGAANLDVSGL
ncbi:hypothetical protein EAH88_15570 [Rhodanobacter glycinis]|uniref:Uncharacterized protein n=1 Tax=Rhodanobacter glycinis TaxID=582702 RepID=A0A502C0B2_9GAMM|nr:hypothetical protein [Rhodanobacter glycinis]TPG05381.1 hypothetical protein EAH88_15570 [Rhodanobacter glycinis]